MRGELKTQKNIVSFYWKFNFRTAFTLAIFQNSLWYEEKAELIKIAYSVESVPKVCN